MQSFKVLTFGSLALPGVLAQSTCGGSVGVSTVTIYETLPPTTVTINPASESLTVNAGAADPEATSTSSTPITEILSLIQASSTSANTKVTEGPYSFAEHDGSTVWLGGNTPPATASLIIQTSAVTVIPVPESGPTSSGELSETESFTTLTLSSTTSRILTKTLTESPLYTSPSAKPFTGLASYGWNSSLTTIKVAGTGNGLTRSTGYAPLGTEVPKPIIGSGPASYVQVTSYIAPRQIGAIVVATINGQTVSWTNEWDGTSRTAVVVPPSETSSSLVAPTTVLGIYPWNLPPVPEVSSSINQPDTFTFRPTEIPQFTATLNPADISSLIPIRSFNYSTKSTSITQPTVTSSSRWIEPTEIPHFTGTLNPADISSFLTLASPSTTKTSASSSPLPFKPLTPSQTSTFSLISLIPGPTAPANATQASGTVDGPKPACSDKSPFTIGFDDLPHFSIGNNPNDTDIPPIFNPYRKLYWEDHFGYVPPPSDPFPPISGEQLAVYRTDENVNVNGSPDAGLELFGEFGAGPRASQSAYWIDAYSVYLGCKNPGPSECVISLNGYVAGRSTRVASQTVTQPPCPGLINCKLALVEFSADFRNLSGVQIIAAVDRRPVTWYIDELELGWSNNTCEATTERNNHR